MPVKNSTIGEDTVIWEPVNIYDTVIGMECSVGMFTEIGGSYIGDYVRVQAHCFIPPGVRIGNECFIGPRVTFMNVKKPDPCSRSDAYHYTIVKQFCVIGAGAVILPGVVLGRNSFIAAGAVVTEDVGDDAMVAGNPARRIGMSPNNN